MHLGLTAGDSVSSRLQSPILSDLGARVRDFAVIYWLNYPDWYLDPAVGKT